MITPHRALLTFGGVAAIALVAGCASDLSTTPRAAARTPSFNQVGPSSNTQPSGERQFGQSSVEPAYDDQTGATIYLLTPDKAPFPSKSNAHAVAPLYLVEYPPGTTVTGFDCAGIPGNCPDHDAEVAGAAVGMMPSVYGTNVAAVPGHDHLVSPPASGGDFNVAWEVVEVLFTNKAAANTRLTTEAAIDTAVAHHDAIKVDLGFAFHCSVVPATVYWKGTPVG